MDEFHSVFFMSKIFNLLTQKRQTQKTQPTTISFLKFFRKNILLNNHILSSKTPLIHKNTQKINVQFREKYGTNFGCTIIDIKNTY